MRSDVKAWEVVGKGLRASAGIVDVALTGSAGISNILADIKAKVIDYHSARASGKIIIQNDVTKMLGLVNLLADGSTFNGTNFINNDQTSVAVTPPPDEGTPFVFAGAGSNVHTIGTTSGTLTVTWARTGTGGGTLQLLYGGVLASQSHNPSNSSGSFSAAFDTLSGTDITLQRNGSPNVNLTYSFQFTADISSGITGGFTVPSDIRGGTIDVQSRSMRTDGLDIDGLDLSVLDAAGTIAQIEAAELEVNQNMAYYGARRRAMTAAIESANLFRDVLEESIGNIVDADLGRESARLVASQIQQQLSQQSLAIANNRPSILLGLLNPSGFGGGNRSGF
jgi:flagellin-like hook-associated protein FlgL